MRYVALGRTGIEISALTLGTWGLAGDSTWGPQDEKAAIDALKTAYDCGINHFDTAVAYGDGRSEELVGTALAGVRDKVVIATKVWPDQLHPSDLIASCEASLKRLATDYVDLLYIHWPNWDIPISDILEAMEKLRQQGKIRFKACSNFGKQDLTELLQHDWVEINQVAYSLLVRAIEFEILPLCITNGVGVACYSPLLHGLLTGKFGSISDFPPGRARTRHFSRDRDGTRHSEPGAEQETFETIDRIRGICDDAGLQMSEVAIAWLLHQAGVTTVVAGARNPEQVRANVSASSLELPSDVLEALSEATDPLKQQLGPNADMWQSDSRIR